MPTAQLLEFFTEQCGLPLQHRQLDVSRRAIDQGRNRLARVLPSLLLRASRASGRGATSPDHRLAQRGVVRRISRGGSDGEELLGHGAVRVHRAEELSHRIADAV